MNSRVLDDRDTSVLSVQMQGFYTKITADYVSERLNTLHLSSGMLEWVY